MRSGGWGAAPLLDGGLLLLRQVVLVQLRPHDHAMGMQVAAVPDHYLEKAAALAAQPEHLRRDRDRVRARFRVRARVRGRGRGRV